jgi:hypothetical protein
MNKSIPVSVLSAEITDGAEDALLDTALDVSSEATDGAEQPIVKQATSNRSINFFILTCSLLNKSDF